MSKLTVVKIGTDTPAGAPFTMNRYINASSFKLVINGTGTNIFELTTGALGATRRFAFAASGQYTMDAYGVGTFIGTAAKWLAVTAAGLVIEEAPPTGVNIYNSNGTLTGVRTVSTAGFNTTWTGSNLTTMFQVVNTNATSGAAAISGISQSNTSTIIGNNLSSGTALQGTATSGTGVTGTSVTGLGAGFSVNPSSTNTVVNVIELTRNTTGTAANGMGGRIQGTLEGSSGTRLAMALDWVWRIVTDGTRTSDVIIHTVNSTVTTESVRFTGPGAMRLRNITSTAASALTAADGDVVYVTDTDATFTAVGFWGREAGTWIKL